MTRPIYEPNLERRDAELGYGTDQLFRRPAPVSGIYPMGLATLTSYTNSPGALDRIDVDTFDVTDNQTIIEANAAGFGLKVNIEGIYLLTLAVLWGAQFNTAKRYLQIDVIDQNPGTFWEDYIVGPTTDATFGGGTIVSTPFYVGGTSGTATPGTITGWAYVDGADAAQGAAALQVIYLGPSPGIH